MEKLGEGLDIHSAPFKVEFCQIRHQNEEVLQWDNCFLIHVDALRNVEGLEIGKGEGL